MSSEAKRLNLQIERIRLDGGTQIRETIDAAVVEEYAGAMREGAAFPPAIVVSEGENYWLADGFHRLQASLLLGRTELECLLYDGSLRDAILVAVKANSAHGLRRTNRDKRRAVQVLLTDEEWSKKSNRWIAQTCGVGRDLVEEVRRQLSDSANRPIEGGAAVRLGLDGKLRPAHRTAPPQSSASDAGDSIEAALLSGEAFDACLSHLKRVANEGERLALGPGGKFLSGVRLADYRMHLDRAANAIAATRPSHRCGRCGGVGCQWCDKCGWLCPSQQRLS